MSQPSARDPLLPSLLDRLIDDDPGQSSEPLWRGSYRLDELREHVRRDLETLLNTRHGRYDLLVDPGRELARSTLTFGLPDFTGSLGGGSDALERVRISVERAVRAFETRLQDVVVVVAQNKADYERDIRLTIHGVLCVDPIVEPVTFDTTVEANTGACNVQPS